MPLATIVTGEADTADICLLIAVIVFFLAAVFRLKANVFDGALVAAGLAFTALGFLVL